MDAAKLAKKILPAGHRASENSASWYKRSGHAGRGMIDKALERAKKLGFVPGKWDNHAVPDGSYMGSSQVFHHPDGWELSYYATYGCVAYDNSFGMDLKKVT